MCVNCQENNSIQKIADQYGIEHQMIQAIEEMAELIQALCKQWKSKCLDPGQNTIEEMADASIMLDQLNYLFKSPRQFENVRRLKIQRQLERMRC